MTNSLKGKVRVAVIGAGPAGIAMGHDLLKSGFSNLRIFEASNAPGGTWHTHSYPGLDCDLFAHPYTFSYRPNPDWSTSFASRAEIERYLQQCATEFGLTRHFVFNTKIVAAQYQADKTWQLIDDAGNRYTFDVVLNAMGNQYTPTYPDVEGIENFAGESWHSTYWRDDVDLNGKRVVVVGSAAAAVQIVPRVANLASHLTVLQRTPNWIMPRNAKRYSSLQRFLFRHCSSYLRLHRWALSMLASEVLNGVTLGHKRMEQFEARVYKFIQSSIQDPKVRELVKPTSRYGCKRGLISDEFYPTLNREHVELVSEGLKAVRPSGITTSSGREIDVDVIIYCTGYRVMDFDRIDVRGVENKPLHEIMSAAPEAFKGIAVPGFPNYFFLAGPNGLAINVSYFTNVERNARTITRLMLAMYEKGYQAIAVKPSVHRAYNDYLADKFSKYSWGHSSCNSYYRTATGQAPFLFPGGFKEYDRLHKQCSLDDFEPR